MSSTKAKLVLSMDGLVLKEIELNKERVTIGRKSSNDIKIDNLAISGHHAAIVTILNDSFLEDKNSTNGTLVNGRPVRKHVLQDGDLIEMGKYKLKFISWKPEKNNVATYENTDAIDPNQAEAEKKETKDSAPPGKAQTEPPEPAETQMLNEALEKELNETLADIELPPASVRILSGQFEGRELNLANALATLGQPGVQVAVVARRPDGYFISSVEGNPPEVNGRRIPKQAHQLNNRDIIEIAGIKMEFSTKIP